MALSSWSLYSREGIDKKMRRCVIKCQTVINLTKKIVRNEKGDEVGLRDCLLTRHLKKVRVIGKSHPGEGNCAHLKR